MDHIPLIDYQVEMGDGRAGSVSPGGGYIRGSPAEDRSVGMFYGWYFGCWSCPIQSLIESLIGIWSEHVDDIALVILPECNSFLTVDLLENQRSDFLVLHITQAEVSMR